MDPEGPARLTERKGSVSPWALSKDFQPLSQLLELGKKEGGSVPPRWGHKASQTATVSTDRPSSRHVSLQRQREGSLRWPKPSGSAQEGRGCRVRMRVRVPLPREPEGAKPARPSRNKINSSI